MRADKWNKPRLREEERIVLSSKRTGTSNTKNNIETKRKPETLAIKNEHIRFIFLSADDEMTWGDKPQRKPSLQNK